MLTNTSSSLGKLNLEIISSSKNQTFLLVEQFLKKPTLNITMIQVQDKTKEKKKLKFKLKNLNTSLDDEK